MSKKNNIIEKLKELNENSEYTYTLISEYKNNKDKCIEVYCSKHKYKWLTRYNAITTGTKCYYCSLEKNKNNRKLDINKIKDIYSFNIYILGEYINSSENNIKCICKKCNNTWITSINKLKYKKCNKCYKNNKSDIFKKDKMINKLKNKFQNIDFSLFTPISISDKSIIKCYIHNTIYKKSYLNLIYSYNKINVCNKCNLMEKENKYLNILKNANSDIKYEFIDGFITTSKRNLQCICPNNHIFITTYHKFLKNPKCSKCNKSFKEKELVNYIKSIYDKTIIENDRSIIKSEYSNNYLEIDIYLPDIKLGIEFNGSYYHTDEVISKTRKGFKTAKEYHEYKYNKCKENNIDLIFVEEIEYNRNKDKILEYIRDIINLKIKTLNLIHI